MPLSSAYSRNFNHYRIDAENGRNGSPGIATRYWLGGPGIESRRKRNFQHPSRPTLWPTQTPTQWVPGLFAVGKAAVAWR